MAAAVGAPPRKASIADLSALIDARVADLIEPGTVAAYVNFPHIDNVGDSAIWLGARRAL